MYLVVIDYYSRYIEVANLTSTTTAHVTGKLKSIFARHGVPETVFMDNGPQFSAAEFAAFARDYDFTHATSSPRYPQSNGEAERAVRTLISLLKKGEDPHKALMAYRATPLSHGSSPAQLLMGRNIRTPLPVSQEKLQPGWPDLKAFRGKDQDLLVQKKTQHRDKTRAQTRTKSLGEGLKGNRDCQWSSSDTEVLPHRRALRKSWEQPISHQGHSRDSQRD